MPSKSQRKPALPSAHLRLAYSAPMLDPATVEELRRLTMPATKALAFVKLRHNDQPLLRPERYWSVAPRGNRRAAVELGRRYARDAIAAMKGDRNPQLVALILQDIIADAVERARSRNGRSQVAAGFLQEISETIAAT